MTLNYIKIPAGFHEEIADNHHKISPNDHVIAGMSGKEESRNICIFVAGNDEFKVTFKRFGWASF